MICPFIQIPHPTHHLCTKFQIKKKKISSVVLCNPENSPENMTSMAAVKMISPLCNEKQLSQSCFFSPWSSDSLQLLYSKVLTS